MTTATHAHRRDCKARPFALAIHACDGARVEIRAGACYARSQAEAIGIGIHEAEGIWPKAQGWAMHGSTAMELKRSWCAGALALFGKPPARSARPLAPARSDPFAVDSASKNGIR